MAFRGLELAQEELPGIFTHGQQAFAVLPGGYLFGRFFLFLYFDMIFLGQVAEGFRVRHVLVLHYKAHGAAGLAAAEALVDAPGGVHVEGGCLLVMEGTAGHIVGAAALERHEVSHHLFNAGGVQNQVYCFPGNHERYSFLKSTSLASDRLVTVILSSLGSVFGVLSVAGL